MRVAGDGETGYREVSADTMKLLLPVRRGAEDDEPVLGMRPNQIGRRIDAAARQAGLGEGFSGDSPRLGMIKDMETVRRTPAGRLRRRERTPAIGIPKRVVRHGPGPRGHAGAPVETGIRYQPQLIVGPPETSLEPPESLHDI